MCYIVNNGISNYDTYIFFTNNQIQKNKILNILKKNNIGTKNLPDAIKWHCASFWKHVLTKNEIRKIDKSFKYLNNSIAIPILFRKSYSFYGKLAKEINDSF